MYPSTIATLTDPQPTDRLNNPSHSALHQSENAQIEAIQTFVGTLSSVEGTLMYDIRSANSNGGGHVQTANKGGTGQTSYSKGDLLVAQSNSVLSKLSASSTAGEVLTVDANAPLGVKWSGVAQNKVDVNTSFIGVDSGPASVQTVLFATSVLGSVLGVNNAIRYEGILQRFGIDNNTNIVFRTTYGENIVSSVRVTSGGGGSSIMGATARISGYVAANQSSVAQVGYLSFDVGSNTLNANSDDDGVSGQGQAFGTSSVNSSGDQSLVITAQYSSGNVQNSILTGLFVVDKIA